MMDEKKTVNKDKSTHVKEKMVRIKESDYLKLIEEVGAYKDQYIRLHAEFDNARKRFEREKMDFVKYANGALIEQFLHVVDDLVRSVEAAKANHQDYSAFLKGIEMVMRQLDELLKNNNVKPIETKGKPFDPHYHEALMMEESDEYEEGMIIEELQKGYILADRVVRTAKVKVAKQKERQEQEVHQEQREQQAQQAQREQPNSEQTNND